MPSDTLRFRRRLLRDLPAVSLVFLALACKEQRSAPTTTPVAAPQPSPEGTATEPVQEPTPAPEPTAVATEPTAFPLDMPSCPSGKWCSDAATARKLAAPDARKVDGCVETFFWNGKNEAEAFKELPRYEVQISHDAQGTSVRRKAGAATACCYNWVLPCPGGRPLLAAEGQGVSLLAELRPGSTWCAAAHAPCDLDDELRRSLGAAWLEDALAEHASVAAFARAALELMALGAPPELLADCHAAALDEIDHARLCFALAERYLGTAYEPGALPAVAPRRADFALLAVATFEEGCVGETIAALVAARGHDGASDSAARAALARIAEDEGRHAALAWRTLDWALERGGDEAARAVTQVAARLRPRAPHESADDPRALAHGRLGAGAQQRARHDAWIDVIDPILEAMVARYGRASSLRAAAPVAS
jgi:hypothetical protein